jgi:hypothetical protein
VNRFQFVADHQGTFEGVAVVPDRRDQPVLVLRLAERGPTRAERATADAELVGRIRAVHDDDNTCGAPRITAELNDGLPVEDRINHKRVGRGDARERHRRLPAPPPGPHHDPRTCRSQGARLGEAGLHRPRGEPALRRRHHLPAAVRRGEPVSGDRDRLLLPPDCRLGRRRPHAHRARRGRTPSRPDHPRQSGRGDVPQRPRLAP